MKTESHIVKLTDEIDVEGTIQVDLGSLATVTDREKAHVITALLDSIEVPEVRDFIMAGKFRQEPKQPRE